MRLLTIGIGKSGAEISSLLYRKGAKVNKIPLFRCYAILNSVEDVGRLKLDEKNKFFLPRVRQDVTGILNEILSRYEIHEGSMLITSLADDYDVNITAEVGKNLMGVSDDPVIILALMPSLGDTNSSEIRDRIRTLKKASTVLLLANEGKADDIVEALNVLARVGEIDLKKNVAGEVVVDTSDVFNALVRDGFSIFGVSRRSLPMFRFFAKRSQILAERTQRMIDMVKEAVNNLSVNGDINTAKSSLIVFAGNPDEITMDGLFACIEYIENINDEIVVRYGDYPIPKAKFLSAVVLFSGITRFKLD
jgi:cell division GTPase FtsZ